MFSYTYCSLRRVYIMQLSTKCTYGIHFTLLSYRRLMFLLLLLLVGFKQKHTAARAIIKKEECICSEFQTSYYIPLIRHYAFRLVFFLPVRKTRRVESCNILLCLFQCQPDVYSLLLTLTYTYTQSVWLADITRKKNTNIFLFFSHDYLYIIFLHHSLTMTTRVSRRGSDVDYNFQQ